MESDSQKLLSFQRRRSPSPVMSVICTHHRSGTVFFLSVAEAWCRAFDVEGQRIEQPLSLPDPSKMAIRHRERPYEHFYEAREKLMTGMHGFVEQCPQLDEKSEGCDLFDSDCWLSMCHLMTAPNVPSTKV